VFEVVKPGLETSVQDLPGRIGFWAQGFPPSGPVDSWSFRLANLLVGNDAKAADDKINKIRNAVEYLQLARSRGVLRAWRCRP